MAGSVACAFRISSPYWAIQGITQNELDFLAFRTMTAAAGTFNVDGQGLSLVPRDAATPEQQER